VTGRVPAPDRARWYGDVARRLGRDALIVLDDIPHVVDGDPFAERLVVLGRAIAGEGGHLVTIGIHPLPQSVSRKMKPFHIAEESVPPFDPDEATELLRALGAPDSILAEGEPLGPDRMRALTARIQGNPLALTALAHALQHKSWHIGDGDAGLLDGEIEPQLAETALRRLLTADADVESRALLGRLSLIDYPFGNDDVRALAEIAPPIADSSARVMKLGGLWIQRDTDGYFVMSALLAWLSDDLGVETRTACHRVLAQRLARRRELDQDAALSAINHFLHAGESDSAGSLLAATLLALYAHDATIPDNGLLQLWVDGPPLPKDLDVAIALYVRVAQIAARTPRRLPTATLVEDLDARVKSAPPKASWGVVMAAVYAPTYANRYLALALQRLPEVRLFDGSPLVIPQDQRLEWLLWKHIDAITTIVELDAWLDVVADLTPPQRAVAFEGPLGEAGCLHIMEGVYRGMLSQSEDDRDWLRLLATLDNVAERARGLGLDLLSAASVRLQISICAKDLKDLPEARARVDSVLAHPPSTQWESRGFRWVLLMCLKYVRFGRCRIPVVASFETSRGAERTR